MGGFPLSHRPCGHRARWQTSGMTNRRALKPALAALGALALALLLAVGLAVDAAPRVEARESVSHEDVGRAVALLRAQDPRHGRPGAMRVVTLGAPELELLLNHGLHRWLRARVAITLERGTATVAVSRPLPAGGWLNAQARIVERGGRPEFDALHLGLLPVPAALAAPLARWLVARHEQGAEIAAAAALVQRVSLFPGRLTVVYAWDAAAPMRMLGSLVPPEEHARLQHYRLRLVDLTRASPAGRPLPVAELLVPLVALARERSGDEAGDDGVAAAENRAALLTLTLYASGRALERIVPAARQWPQPVPRRLTLAGREDLALHFLISAAIAVDGTSPLSRAVGIYKEVTDARGGSGFSFNDLAADRAGTRFGELAQRHPRELQQRLAAGAEDDALMPPWADLPEYLNAVEFRRRFGDVGAPAYERLVAEIDRRIAALPVLR